MYSDCKQTVSLPIVSHCEPGSTPQWNYFQEQKLYIFHWIQFFQWAGIAKKKIKKNVQTLTLAITLVLTKTKLHMKSIKIAIALGEMLENWIYNFHSVTRV